MERIEEKVTVGEIVATLRGAVKIGKLKRNFASPLYNSLQKYYSESTRDSEKWEDIVFSRDDFESRMKEFRNQTEYEDKTAFAYKSRARRAIEVYENQKTGDAMLPSSNESEIRFLENLRAYWKKTLLDSLSEKAKNIEVIQCRTYGNGAAAIVVSSDSFAADLKEEYKTIRSLLDIAE